LYSCNSWCKRR